MYFHQLGTRIALPYLQANLLSTHLKCKSARQTYNHILYVSISQGIQWLGLGGDYSLEMGKKNNELKFFLSFNQIGKEFILKEIAFTSEYSGISD